MSSTGLEIGAATINAPRSLPFFFLSGFESEEEASASGEACTRWPVAVSVAETGLSPAGACAKQAC